MNEKQNLINALPDNVTLDECEVVPYDGVQQDHTVIWDDYINIPAGNPVAILPGWIVTDETGEDMECKGAKSADEAVNEWMVDCDYYNDQTTWERLKVWREGVTIDEDGDPVYLILDETEKRVTIDPPAPECTEDEHDWQSPYELVGGLRENPGVFGHGGGVIIVEVCPHCGMYRETDTWAQDPTTGEQGLRSIRYMKTRHGDSLD